MFVSCALRKCVSLPQTEEDILLRKELDEVHRNHPDKLNLWYTLDKPSEGISRWILIMITVEMTVKVFCLCSCDRVEIQQRVCWCWHDKRPSPASGQGCAHRDVRSTPHDPARVSAKPRQAGLQNREYFCILSLLPLILHKQILW